MLTTKNPDFESIAEQEQTLREQALTIQEKNHTLQEQDYALQEQLARRGRPACYYAV